MNRLIALISIISIIILKSSLVVAEAEKIIHIHINDEQNSNSSLNGYEMNFKEDDNITTLDSNEISGKAIVDAINNDAIDVSDSVNVKNGAYLFVIPVIGMFCIYVVATIGFLIKKKSSEKSKPRRKSLHFEDDDELSKILVQSPAATAIGVDSLTVRSITQDTHSKNTFGKTKREVSFLPINHAYKVTLPWDPKHLDEIKLKVGDIVCIKKCYSDGYSYGRNVTSRVDGIFPTCCLSTMEESIDQAAIEEWINSGMTTPKKRTTSLFLNDLSYKI